MPGTVNDGFAPPENGCKVLSNALLQAGPKSSNGHTPQIPDADTRPNHGRSKGRQNSRIQDHPEWSTNLNDRHILEPATASGAWVEREDWAGQDVLVRREKRRDGSPGATRRRLPKQVSINGKKPQKVRWQYRGRKTDEPFYYAGTLDE